MQRIHFINTHDVTKKQLQSLQEQYMESPLSLLDMTPEEAQRVVDRIASFYKAQLKETGLEGYVVGMSGGIDSTLVAYLTAGAVGPERVFGVLLPLPATVEGDIDDTLEVVRELGIEHNDYHAFREKAEKLMEQLEDMGEVVLDSELQRVKHGNMQARLRMIILRDFARAKNYLVAGTSNASERLLGYATLAGDGFGGIDNEGLDQLFKSTEKKLARYLQLPMMILEKEPSARLWDGQTDEGELGMSYENIDQILVGHMLGIAAEQIQTAIDRPEVTLGKIGEILDRVRANRYKSQLPPVAELY